MTIRLPVSGVSHYALYVVERLNRVCRFRGVACWAIQCEVAWGTGRVTDLEPDYHLGSVALISEGDQVPKFSLQADDGTTVTLESLAGENVVLFFYPKDNTSG